MWILIYKHSMSGEIALVHEGELNPYAQSLHWKLFGRTKFNLYDEGDNELPVETE